MKVYGLIGYPLAHSFSQKYFTQKFEREKIDAVFENYSIESIDLLNNILESDRPPAGLSVTIPYKESILAFIDELDPLARQINAVNCVRIEGKKRVGYNTDAIGFEQSLLRKLRPEHHAALILGTGGASKSVAWVLNKLNIPYRFVSRKKEEGRLGYEEIDEDVIKEHPLIINCTPLGTFPRVDECPPIPYEFLGDSHFLFDLTYNPEKSLFLQKGEEQGSVILNGYEMLVLQAEAAWTIWNGGN